jgi:hypothetical protein
MVDLHVMSATTTDASTEHDDHEGATLHELARRLRASCGLPRVVCDPAAIAALAAALTRFT